MGILLPRISRRSPGIRIRCMSPCPAKSPFRALPRLSSRLAPLSSLYWSADSEAAGGEEDGSGERMMKTSMSRLRRPESPGRRRSSGSGPSKGRPRLLSSYRRRHSPQGSHQASSAILLARVAGGFVDAR